MVEETWKRIGVLVPPLNVSMEPDMNSWVPDGVTVHPSSIAWSGSWASRW